MSKFDPKDHLIDLRGKAYLPVNMRLVWFREDHPGGSIQTEVINFAPIAIRASVYSADGVLLATGHGTANSNGKQAVWTGREIEKAETAAIGRALGHAGFGTQFDNDDDDLDNLSDSPIELLGRNAAQTHQEAPISIAAGQNVPMPQNAQNSVETAKSRFAGNGAPPAGQKKDSSAESQEWTATAVTVRKSNAGKPYLQYTCDQGKPTSYGRDMLRSAGYECEEWTKENETYPLNPPAKVTVAQNGKFWNVTALAVDLSKVDF